MTQLTKENRENREKRENKVLQWLLQIPAWIGTPFSLILHTLFFAISLSIPLWSKITFEEILLWLTTVVSLEAIYLSLFIQISVNQSNATIAEIQEDVEEIQEDVEDIQEDVEDIQEEIIEEEDGAEMVEDAEVKSPSTKVSPKTPLTQDEINRQILRELKSIKSKLRRLQSTQEVQTNTEREG
jgi:cell division protein FtsL